MVLREYNNGGRSAGFYLWLAHIKLSRLIGLLLVILIVVPLVAHYYISNLSMDGDDTSEGHRTRKIQDHDEISSSRLTDLRFQIDDLKRIKASVNNELRDLENKRQRLHAEISGYNTHIEELKNAYETTRYELEQLKVTIENTKLEQEEIIKRNMPEIAAPRRILPSVGDMYVAPPTLMQQCRMHTCFDYSRCSLSSGFPVYVYDSEKYPVTGTPIDTFIKLSVIQSIHGSPYYTADPHVACVYVVLVGDVTGGLRNITDLGAKLQGLPHWNGDGRNHLLVNLARYYGNRDVFDGVDTARAIIIQSAFTNSQFRDGFDLVIPPSLGLSQGDIWDELPPIVPALRKHLLSFQGDYWSTMGAGLGSVGGAKSQYQADHVRGSLSHDLKQANQGHDFERAQYGAKKDVMLNKQPDVKHLEGERTLNQLDKEDSNPNVMPHFRNLLGISRKQSKLTGPQNHRSPADSQTLLNFDLSIIDILKRMQIAFPSDSFHFEFSCDKERIVGINCEWCLCGADNDRRDLLHDSTFSLIIAPTNVSIATTLLTQVRLYEALKYGAIPVVLGDHTKLPFAELLLWQHAMVTLPKARITELHFVIRSFSDPDILEMRRRGRIFWENYFSTTDSIVKTMLATVRTRLKISAAPTRDEPTPSVFAADFEPLKEEIPDIQLQADDILGPIEAPFPSVKYRRNYTMLDNWFNMVGDPFHSYPFTPYEPVMPGEAKFKGSGLGFRPIGKGEGGAGKEFSEALGGNIPREQFTVVILTYEREAVLIDAIARLKGLPHLNKVLVIWNNPQPPADDLRWPQIGVEVMVVRTAKNSLNNRFLPYDAIETEAVLSIDDDAHLRHDEIVFGFRVWRENRDRIVGFPGRFHAWDLKGQSWAYNSNYSCELSMVLTGAAFFHKYYSYLYSYVMPQAIRDKVDEYLNCEDLAMNFLVSHITRKPPIKVTSRWTFRCPGCPNALSVDDSHFQERHKCINFFIKVYGYMPLLYTQHRVDSVLFKTRISHDKQKCFKFI